MVKGLKRMRTCPLSQLREWQSFSGFNISMLFSIGLRGDSLEEKLCHSSASQKFRDSPDKRCELFRTNNRQVTFLLFPILRRRSGKYNLCFLSGWRQIIITDGLHNGFSSTEWIIYRISNDIKIVMNLCHTLFCFKWPITRDINSSKYSVDPGMTTHGSSSIHPNILEWSHRT